ncbi:unnamed protein product [Periconia digitata]|uniref:N-acetyltransferase domain-containing protein n=1 Tax=Periconia digitata TaxID=1303443 RepID=A0A9W4UN41_9PLEO|nr:unnamed protein product [Periconia digitata]
MRILVVPTTIILYYIGLVACQQQVLRETPILRNASLSDADDIASVIIAAFSPTPPWQYIYSFAKRHPKEHHRCIRSGIVRGFSDPSYHAQVIEAPEESNLTVAAVAIWQQKPSQNDMFLHGILRRWGASEQRQTCADCNKGQCEHRDLNVTRALDLERKSIVATRKYVDEPFGPDQLYLNTLCAHPDFQLQGAGTRLVKSGIEAGRRKNVNVTLIALPTSESFYVHVGFDSMQNFTIATVDEDGLFRYNVMAYNFTR